MSQKPDTLISVSSEKAVLGAILSSQNAINVVEAQLKPDDFSDQKHKWVYEVCLELAAESQPIDPVTVKERLQESAKLIDVGGFDYLINLANNTPSFERVETYANILYRLSTLRGLVNTAYNIADMAKTAQGQGLTEIFAKVRGMVDSIEPSKPEECLLLWLDSFGVFYENQLKRLEELELIAQGKMADRATLEWKNTKYFIRTIRPETFGVVAADSGVGKTSFLECLAEHNAKHGLKVVFFHLELSHQTMLDRRTVRHSREPLEIVESGEITEAMKQAEDRMREWIGAVHYVHCPNWSARRIANYARMMHNKGLCDFVIVDYLQKVRLYYRPGWNDELALADVGEVFKNSAESLGIPYFMGSQMNRASKKEARRTATGIRGTGQIEEKSNLVITLDREILNQELKGFGDVYEEGERSPITKVRVDKNTFGKTGDTMLVMVPKEFKFVDAQIEYLNEVEKELHGL